MAIGRSIRQERFESPGELLGDRLKGVYRLLAENGDRMFPDEYFADMYVNSRLGRPTIPSRVLAVVMLLQAHEGLSDRDAVERLQVDLRWQAAAGVHTSCVGFHPTVLVGLRNRLRGSDRPRRLFEDTKIAARQAKLLHDRVRVLDSSPIHDAVATQDTVTQLRSAIRKLLSVLDQTDRALAARVRSVLVRDDAYATPGKPPCDWDDRDAREALVDALVRDALAALTALDGRQLTDALQPAVDMLAVVAGQDVELSDDGTFRIRRGVAKDRMISTVDPEARHGHKSRNRKFDGYKAHLSVDPDSELIDEVCVTAANTPDRDAVDELLDPTQAATDKPDVMGDSAYADGDTRTRLGEDGYDVVAKVPPASNRAGRFSKDDFTVDTDAGTVTCPASHTVSVTPKQGGGGQASFRQRCAACPLRAKCTNSQTGRTIQIHRHETTLQHAKREQQTPEWQAAYRATRPKVERKIAHFMRRPWGSRKARVRGKQRIATDVDTRAAVVNWQRLTTLGAKLTPNGWTAPQPA